MLIIENTDAVSYLRSLPNNYVDCVICSPPYLAQRDYSADGYLWEEVRYYPMPGLPEIVIPEWRGELGLEPTVEAYIGHLILIFREAKRVLKPTGNFWLNIGDKHGRGTRVLWEGDSKREDKKRKKMFDHDGYAQSPAVMKEKSLALTPQRIALAMDADGWYVRMDVILSKCLSGGTYVYAKFGEGITPIMIKDLYRSFKVGTPIFLWNGEQWTKVLKIEKTNPTQDSITRKKESRRRRYSKLNGKPFEISGDLEIELRSGEKIACTREHKFPTSRGLVFASELKVGDFLESTKLPEPEIPSYPVNLPDKEIGWFIGTYLADGSMSGNTIQISSNRNELERFEKLKQIAKSFDAICRIFNSGSENGVSANISSDILSSLLKQYVNCGNSAKTKHLSTKAWKRNNEFLNALLEGYLEGDGHLKKNEHWSIAFTNNEYLAVDLRTLCSRLGIYIRLRRTQHSMKGRKFPGFRGEIYYFQSGHFNCKNDTEIVRIGASRARSFYDIEVEDEPHLFALASGVLTHNSNSMPESVQDRFSSSHEYFWHFTKKPTYWFDMQAVAEPVADSTIPRSQRGISEVHKMVDGAPGQSRHSMMKPRENAKNALKQDGVGNPTYTGFNERWNTKMSGGDFSKKYAGAQLEHGGDSHRKPYLTRSRRSVMNVTTHGSAYDYCRCGKLYLGSERKQIRGERVNEETGKIEKIMLPCLQCGKDSDYVAHFAAFYKNWIEPVILSSCPPICCAECGTPYERIVRKVAFESESENDANDGSNNKEPYQQNNPHRTRLYKNEEGEAYVDYGGRRKRADAPGAEITSKTSMFNTGKVALKETADFPETDDPDRLEAERIFKESGLTQAHLDALYNEQEGLAQQRRSGGVQTGGTKKVTLGKTHLTSKETVYFPPTNRPQRKRAEELFVEHGLTQDHLDAISAVGIADTGKSLVITNGSGKNDPEMRRLADEAKEALGGYYREFLTGNRETLGWQKMCKCEGADTVPGIVCDMFSGSGTSAMTALANGRDFVGCELNSDYHPLSLARIDRWREDPQFREDQDGITPEALERGDVIGHSKPVMINLFGNE